MSDKGWVGTEGQDAQLPQGREGDISPQDICGSRAFSLASKRNRRPPGGWGTAPYAATTKQRKAELLSRLDRHHNKGSGGHNVETSKKVRTKEGPGKK